MECPKGVYSHATALRLRELSDANPAKLHMTVPPAFRRNSPVPPPLVLHKARLEPWEIVAGPGYAVTTVMRAITDLAQSGQGDRDIIAQALREGLRRGLVTCGEIKCALACPAVPAWLRKLLEKP